MYGLNHLLGSNDVSRFSRPRTSPQRPQKRPNLEELERRDVPAPVATTAALVPGALLGQLPSPSVIQSPLVNVAPGAAFNATQALTTSAPNSTTFTPGSAFVSASAFPANQPIFSPITGASSLGLPTAGIGSSFAVPFLISSNATPIPIGVPNPVRVTPATPATVGPLGSLPGTAPYTVGDMALSGGGGGVGTDYRGRPVDIGTSEESEDGIEDSILEMLDVGAAPTSATLQEAVLQEAIFQLTV
jgi:hypothetical protein